MKRLIGIILSLIAVISMAVPISAVSSEDADYTIYRNSVVIPCNCVYPFNYICNIVAYKSGRIHIEINSQSPKTGTFGSFNVGSIKIDDSVIQDFEFLEDDFQETTTPYSVKYSVTNGNSRYGIYNGRITKSYDGKYVIYNMSTEYYQFGFISDMYINKMFLDSSVHINVFDTDIVIPFGDSSVNKDFGDINGDNLVDVADAQMILNYYVYTLVDSNAEPLEEWISKQ